MEAISSTVSDPSGTAGTVTINPYAPPAARVADFKTDKTLTRASIGRRFLNFVIDYACCIVLAAILFAASASFFGDAWLDQLGPVRERLLGLFIYFSYYLVLEGLWGCTPAKLLTRTRVCNEDGSRPSFQQILGRTCARCVPLEPFSFLGRELVGWHDRWSGTGVFVVSK